MADFPLPSNLGVFKRVAGADPAANAEVTDSVPTGKSWILLAVKLTLVQGATQTPQPILQLDDGSGGAVFYESIGSSAVQAVSTTCTYTFASHHILSGQIGATTNVRSFAPLPNDVILLQGWRIKTTTLGIGANSDYGVPQYYVCELG